MNFLPSGPCVHILVYLGLDTWAPGSCDEEQGALTLIQPEAGSSGEAAQRGTVTITESVDKDFSSKLAQVVT